ncbi:MAG: aldehyde dehydrogenase family protein [Caulobacteraceae bacterium]
MHEKVFDKVVEGVSEMAKNLKVGPGQDPETQMGPLVSQKQLERVTGYVQSGRDEGAGGRGLAAPSTATRATSCSPPCWPRPTAT